MKPKNLPTNIQKSAHTTPYLISRSIASSYTTSARRLLPGGHLFRIRRNYGGDKFNRDGVETDSYNGMTSLSLFRVTQVVQKATLAVEESHRQ